MASCKHCGATLVEGNPACPVCGSAAEVRVSPRSQSASAPNTQKVAKKKKKWPIVVAVIVVLLIAGNLMSKCKAPVEKVDWPTGVLAQMIPSMKHKCDFAHEHEESLSISVSDGIKKTEFDQYREACKEKGFNVEAKEGGDSYEAYNAEGYGLELSFWDGSKEKTMYITLEAPKANGSLTWPSMGLATLLPDPGKSKGTVEADSSSRFFAYVGEVSREEYSAYIDACIALGFAVDYDKGEDFYSAKNSAGDKLKLEYAGLNTMSVSLDATDETRAAQAESESAPALDEPSAQDSSESAEASAPQDFKETMDAYEAFMNNYVDFMVKYKDSGNVFSMAVDYTKLMGEYSEWAKKIEAIDESALSDEDYAYWIEVQSRVNERLLSL